jgi:hypothetical protein
MKRVIITGHALHQMQRRSIPVDLVNKIVEAPEQSVEVRPGRLVLQSKVMMGEPLSKFLIRVFVDVAGETVEVVTVYRTRKIEKYWR